MSRAARILYRGATTRSVSTACRFRPVIIIDGHGSDVESPRFNEPVVLKRRLRDIPAIAKWFTPSQAEKGFHDLNPTYFEHYYSTLVPLELTRHSGTAQDGQHRTSFERLEAPLALLISHITSPASDMGLYLAQCSLGELPAGLQADLPTPALLPSIGRGDIYASSLWMGRPPTTTPLHRDPNPNLFVQLAGRKVIRLIEPDKGKKLYERLRDGRGHANMRGEEMMVGEEIRRLEEAVWSDSSENPEADGMEATLDSGDALFIPLGWWHAVHGVGNTVNASVNWWFR